MESRAWARWILPRDDRISMATKGDTQQRVHSITEKEEEKEKEGSPPPRLITPTVPQDIRENDRYVTLWRSHVGTRRFHSAACNPLFDRSIPTLADIGSRATPPPLLASLPYQLVIAQHDSLHTLRSTPPFLPPVIDFPPVIEPTLLPATICLLSRDTFMNESGAIGLVMYTVLGVV